MLQEEIVYAIVYWTESICLYYCDGEWPNL